MSQVETHDYLLSPGQSLVRDPVATLDDPSAVDDDRVGHRVEFLVEGRELVPVGDDDGAEHAGECGVRGVGVVDVVEVLSGVLGGNRIVRGHGRAALSEPPGSPGSHVSCACRQFRI